MEKGFTEGLDVPYCTHSSLLPVMSSYLPLLDELCCSTALFIKTCLESDSPIASIVARYMVSHYVNSHISKQHRASMLFLLELLFVREGVHSCPLLSADDIKMFVDFICIS